VTPANQYQILRLGIAEAVWQIALPTPAAGKWDYYGPESRFSGPSGRQRASAYRLDVRSVWITLLYLSDWRNSS